MKSGQLPQRNTIREEGGMTETQKQGAETRHLLSDPMMGISTHSVNLWSTAASLPLDGRSGSGGDPISRRMSAIDRVRHLEDLLASRNCSYPLSSYGRGVGHLRMLGVNRVTAMSRFLPQSMLFASSKNDNETARSQAACQASNRTGEIPAQKPSSQQQADTKQQAATKVPCRARGMPTGHDFEHAYFMLQADIKHGEELNCSHPGCRAEGTKFCYCAYCKTPVAKRNFRVRHHHFDEDPPVSGVESNAHQKMQKGLKAMSPTKRPIAAAAGIPSPSSKKSKIALRMLSQTKRQANNWDRLLGSRPPKTDKDAIAKWIEQVFITSSSYQHPRDDEKEESDVPDPPALNILIESALQDEKDDSISVEKHDLHKP